MTLKHWLIALAATGLAPAAAGAQPAGVPAEKQEQAAAAATGPAAPSGVGGAPSSAGPNAAATNPSAAPATPAAPGALVDPTPGASAVAPANPAAPAVAAPAFQYAPATPGIGNPDGRLGLQDQFTPIGREAAAFHNNWLLVLCAAISIFVLGLLAWTMIRYRRSAHPVPSRTSHNTFVEVVWTLVPVLILVAFAVPSIRLIRHQYSPPPADITIKVTGHQWYWTYQYPDHGGFEIVSNMLKERDQVAAGARFRTAADGPRLLAVDERLVIPAGKTVKFIVTSADVIHSFAMPAFWIKKDANPGILNETWVRVDRPGVYFGQCSELCGARHAFMPIAIEVVSPQRFNQWIAAKGGTLPGTAPAAADSTAATVVTPSAAGAPAPVAGQPAAAPPTSAQPAAPGNTTPGVANRATDGTQ